MCFRLKIVLRLPGKGNAVTHAFPLNSPLPTSAFLELYGQHTSPKNSFQTEICLRKKTRKESQNLPLKFIQMFNTWAIQAKHLCNSLYPSGGICYALQIISAQKRNTTIYWTHTAPYKAVRRWTKLSFLVVSITTVKALNPSPCTVVYSIIETQIVVTEKITWVI